MHDLTEAEALDRFMCGLYPVLQKDILMKDPYTCEDALIAAERIGAIHNYVMVKVVGSRGSKLVVSNSLIKIHRVLMLKMDLVGR